MFTVNNFSNYAHKAWGYSHDALDTSARFLGDGINKVIQKVNLKFEETDVGQKLQRAWVHVRNTKICDSDETTQAVKKAAFALLISFPAILLFKDIIKHTNLDYLTDLSLIGGAQQLIKSMVYIYIVMSILDFALSYAHEELTEKKIATS